MNTQEHFADSHETVRSAAALIRSARYLTAFTGAGISVESGIPPFRGPGGLWGKYDPHTLELDYFLADPARAWPVIKEIFYDNFGRAKPNRAHEVLSAWEKDGWPRGAGSSERGFLKCLITQNIDSVQ
jgi:NAD-dependent deacetylase